MAGTTNIGGRGPAGDISFNYVPLIDITVVLVIFFMLSSEISSAQKARVLVPNPHVPQAVGRESVTTNNVVVAVVSNAADVPDAKPEIAAGVYRYEVDGTDVGDNPTIEELVARIKEKKAAYEGFLAVTGQKGDFFVEIRADYRLSFGKVQPVIEAIAAAGIPRMAISTKKAM